MSNKNDHISEMEAKLAKLKAEHVDTPAQAKARKLIKPLFISIGVMFLAIFGILISPTDSENQGKTTAAVKAKYSTSEPISQNPAWPDKISSLSAHAKPYSIIEVSDYSFAGRKRVKWFITAPDANNYETYLGTAIQAAKDLAQKSRVSQANVIIEPSSKLVGMGYNLALVTFTVDGKGNAGEVFDGEYWQAAASNTPPEPLRVEVAEIWYKNRANFQNANGLTDEPRLVKFISTKLGIPESKVNMPWVDQVKLAL
ncbi:hypothetical protein [Shewanella sp. GutDb-MelDb]|uniref:DUF4875 domain-containing protein n=1 Tax=Shewanella sp. GutDb-MelDb TaxID=2058316 RepID=UPI000C79DEDF|nr:hypothetical protein [Shewanella sp. GutDb-MelDb]PKG58004.1 hypothetical protein CXF82_06760 [Shewanella sp. GutDb-MelDb]